MACAAVPGTVDQILAAIPRRGACRVRRERPRIVKQPVPAGDEAPLVERKRQLRRRRHVLHRRLRHEVRIECEQVRLAQLRERRVRERRVQVRAVARDAFAHRARERRIRPRADAGVRIGREVRRVDRAERRIERGPARVGRAAGRRVAHRAIAGERDKAAALERRRAPHRAVRAAWHNGCDRRGAGRIAQVGRSARRPPRPPPASQRRQRDARRESLRPASAESAGTGRASAARMRSASNGGARNRTPVASYSAFAIAAAAGAAACSIRRASCTDSSPCARWAVSVSSSAISS